MCCRELTDACSLVLKHQIALIKRRRDSMKRQYNFRLPSCSCLPEIYLFVAAATLIYSSDQFNFGFHVDLTKRWGGGKGPNGKNVNGNIEKLGEEKILVRIKVHNLCDDQWMEPLRRHSLVCGPSF